MIGRILSKGFAVAVIFLFLCVGIQPAFANDVFNSNTSIDNEQILEKETHENHLTGLGFIICQITSMYYWHYAPPFVIPKPLIPIICEDLDTDSKRIGITRLFGFHIFKFLPTGHNYKLTFYISPKRERLISNFNGFTIIKLHIE